MRASVGLYYPHVEFRTDDWLKWALLLWDGGIRRIVPANVTPWEPLFMEKAEAAGAIHNTDPAPYLDKVASIFERRLDSLEKLHFVIRDDEGEIGTRIGPVAALGAVRYDKIAAGLADRMLSDGIATEYPDSRGRMLSMPRGLVALYMTILAETMSDAIGAPVVTDRPQYAKLARRVERLLDEEDPSIFSDTQVVVQHIVFEFVDPRSVELLSFDDVLRIRETRRSEMVAFRDAVEGIVSSIVACTDLNARDDLLRDGVNRVKATLKEHSAAMKAEGLAMARQALGVTGFGTIGARALDQFTGNLALGTSAGVAIMTAMIGGEFWFTKRSRSAPFQYLLSLQRELL